MRDDELSTETLFKQVIFQALNDALGYTNESYGASHIKIVRTAQVWWTEDNQGFRDVCEMASVDSRVIKPLGIALIQAKISGDHSRIPAFWRQVFKNGRAPSLLVIEKAMKAIDKARGAF